MYWCVGQLLAQPILLWKEECMNKGGLLGPGIIFTKTLRCALVVLESIKHYKNSISVSSETE